MKRTLFLLVFFLASCAGAPEAPLESEVPSEEEPVEATLMPPIENFETGITLKSFGTYITSATSPVQPERFSGYHTGVDVEATELEGEVPVHSIADGQVVFARSVDGYGGVVVIEHSFDGEAVLALYGHLDMGSVTLAVGDAVGVGQELGVLGEGYTGETDGERKHLHFGLIRGSTVNLRGYVQTESELEGWIDPLAFFAK